MCIWKLGIDFKSEGEGNVGVTWARRISWFSADTCEEKEVFQGKTRGHIIFSEVFGLNTYPLDVMLFTLKIRSEKWLTFLMDANDLEYGTTFNLFVSDPEGPAQESAPFVGRMET